MSEKTGFLFCLLIFSVFILPFGGNLFYVNFHVDQFMKTTLDVQKVMSEEGGITNRMIYLTTGLQEKGYEINFTNEEGDRMDGLLAPGEVVHIQYKCQFRNFFGEINELTTSNQVHIEKRKVMPNGAP